MTLIVPNVVDHLTQTSFRFSIDKIPNSTFHVQKVILPGISLGAPEQGTPFTHVPIPGEIAAFDPFSMEFIVDEKLENYRSIVEWIFGISFPVTHQQYIDFVDNTENTIDPNQFTQDDSTSMYGNGILHINNAHNQVVAKVTMREMFPIHLSPLIFDTTVQDIAPITATVNFRIDHYEFAVE